ncbi:hypothetical protein IC235_08725 [Hymenobacter sp. BT664]|uniref:Carboxypeptidase regulatory-like domain-containing protein n=1 Tax=Hymenobacter montanus TaxID=2771359 RepID=A0A927BBY8_9BACT|nr:hypothetical protein [Hymenobacter montanus]MBD2767975.1 hypothetical protein [Hymenobacter montanus]
MSTPRKIMDLSNTTRRLPAGALLALCLSGLALASCDRNDDYDLGAATPLQGQVLDVTTGQAVPLATVRLLARRSAAQPDSITEEIEADAQGNFSFAPVLDPAQTYTLSALLPGTYRADQPVPVKRTRLGQLKLYLRPAPNAFQQQLDQLIGQLAATPLPTEQRNGYRVTFGNLPPQWTRLIKLDMTRQWQPIGQRGMNYFAIGRAENDNAFSNRTNLNSKYYQAWVGAYVVDGTADLFDGVPNADINATIRAGMPQMLARIARFSELDQAGWLTAAGDPSPLASTGPSTKVGEVNKFGLTIPLYAATQASHSDLTTATNEISELIGMPPAAIWQNKVGAYHPVSLNVYYLPFYDAEKRLLVIGYAASANYTTRQGNRRDNEDKLKEQLLNILKSIELVRL